MKLRRMGMMSVLVLLPYVVTAAPAAESPVKVEVDWPAFIGRHDLVWDALPGRVRLRRVPRQRDARHDDPPGRAAAPALGDGPLRRDRTPARQRATAHRRPGPDHRRRDPTGHDADGSLECRSPRHRHHRQGHHHLPLVHPHPRDGAAHRPFAAPAGKRRPPSPGRRDPASTTAMSIASTIPRTRRPAPASSTG